MFIIFVVLNTNIFVMKENRIIYTRRIEGSEILDSLSCAAISKRFFNRSRAWFTQRLNNNIVNGKPASFTEEELIKLSFALREICYEINTFCNNINPKHYKYSNYIDSAIDDKIRIVGGYKNIHLGIKLFPNEDGTFESLAYYCYKGEVDWYPIGDAEATNRFATEDEASEFAISILKDQISFWEGRDH